MTEMTTHRARNYPHGRRMHRWRLWITGGWADPLLDRNVSDKVIDMLEIVFERPLVRLTCAVFGHQITGDQCGKPEHDFCLWCRSLFPGEAERVARGPTG